jgi:hypothetical protein
MKKCFLFILLAIFLAGCVPTKIDSVQAFSQVLMLALFALFTLTALVRGSLGLVMLFRVLGLLFRSSKYLFIEDEESEPVLSWQRPEVDGLYQQMDSDQAWLFSELLSSNLDEAGPHDSSGVDFLE